MAFVCHTLTNRPAESFREKEETKNEIIGNAINMYQSLPDKIVADLNSTGVF